MLTMVRTGTTFLQELLTNTGKNQYAYRTVDKILFQS